VVLRFTLLLAAAFRNGNVVARVQDSRKAFSELRRRDFEAAEVADGPFEALFLSPRRGVLMDPRGKSAELLPIGKPGDAGRSIAATPYLENARGNLRRCPGAAASRDGCPPS
jgi:hypothetical protein